MSLHEKRANEAGPLDSPTVDEVLKAAGLGNLTEETPLEAIELALKTLGELSHGLDPVGLEAVRAGAIRAVKPLGFRAAAVDAVLQPPPERSDGSTAGSDIQFQDPEPWPDAVEGTELLDELQSVLSTYIALPDWAAEAIALWVMHAHAHDTATISPILALTSPEKRCGKTTTLHLLSALVPRPLTASNITAAALFRAVERLRPTLLIDEADTFLNDQNALRGILNSGHLRGTATAVRAVGDDHDVRYFSTWAPKAIAKIGHLPDTLTDRSVTVRLRRKLRGEAVERLRLDRLGQFAPLARKAQRWVRDNEVALRASDPDVPSELHDRGADNWRPLLAIADTAGGDWPSRAREAARHLAGVSDEDDGSIGTLLLRDLRLIFLDRCVDRLSSREIANALIEREDRPWQEWGRAQKPISTPVLAKLLKPFDIKPTQFKRNGEKVRGYLLTELEPAFERYLEPMTSGDVVPPVPPKNDGQEAPLVGGYPTGLGTGCVSLQIPLIDGLVPGVPLDAGERDGNGTPYEQFERWCIQTEDPLEGWGGHA